MAQGEAVGLHSSHNNVPVPLELLRSELERQAIVPHGSQDNLAVPPQLGGRAFEERAVGPHRRQEPLLAPVHLEASVRKWPSQEALKISSEVLAICGQLVERLPLQSQRAQNPAAQIGDVNRRKAESWSQVDADVPHDRPLRRDHPLVAGRPVSGGNILDALSVAGHEQQLQRIFEFFHAKLEMSSIQFEEGEGVMQPEGRI
mmetsp:Transcript_23540/g.58624  ORF Transcript_23540/g.58624 Transcript_23540/m.58624 type:complete len:202 (-) Transcript_23540:333-938(-)